MTRFDAKDNSTDAVQSGVLYGTELSAISIKPSGHYKINMAHRWTETANRLQAATVHGVSLTAGSFIHFHCFWPYANWLLINDLNEEFEELWKLQEEYKNDEKILKEPFWQKMQVQSTYQCYN